MTHDDGPGVAFVHKLVSVGACDSGVLFESDDHRHQSNKSSATVTENDNPQKPKKKDLMKFTGMKNSLSMDDLATVANNNKKNNPSSNNSSEVKVRHLSHINLLFF